MNKKKIHCCDGLLKIILSFVYFFVVFLKILTLLLGGAATSDVREHQVTWNRLDRTFTAYACEYNKYLEINCTGNKNINVTYANYGRDDDLKRCGPKNEEEEKRSKLWNLTCIAKNTLDIVRKKCRNMSEGGICTVEASNDVFSDPCRETPKYLIATWQCLPVDYDNVSTDYDDDHSRLTTAAGLVNSNELICPSEMLRFVRWPATKPGSQAVMPCPNNINLTNAMRSCDLNPVQWSTHPDLSQCVSQKITYLLDTRRKLNENLTLDTVNNLLDDMVRMSRDDGNLIFGGDVTAMTSILLETVDLTDDANRRRGSSFVTEDAANKINEAVVNVASNLLSDEVEISWKDMTEICQAETATRVMSAVENSATLLANSAFDAKATGRIATNLAIQVDVLGVDQTEGGATFPKPSSDIDEQEIKITSLDNIRIAKEDIKKNAVNGLTRVIFVRYKNVGKWLKADSVETNEASNTSTTMVKPMKRDTTAADDESEARRIVNTAVISASLKMTKLKDSSSMMLDTPVRFTLHHKQKENVSDPICVYWKYSKETYQGHWSNEGCSLVTTSSSHTVCECNHLTNFAVLMSVSSNQMSNVHRLTLSFVTYFGCTISIICLALTFLTFFWFKNLQSDRNTIHKNLVLSLFIAEVVFLLGIVQYDKPILCSVVAGLLHYFFLASFVWMALEGVQLYILLIEVFEAEKSRVKWYYLAGYGLPSVIISLSAAIDHTGYGSPDHCWLKVENGFIWAFVGPALVIVVANSTMLAVAIYMMYRHSTTSGTWKTKEKSKQETIGVWIKGAFVLMVLLGSTWLFGLFYINQDLLFMAYIFTIVNSLQGLFIFVFHCLTNEKVQKEYKRFIEHSTWLPESFRARYGLSGSGGAISTTPNQSTTSSDSNGSMIRYFKSFKRNQSPSSSSSLKSPGHSKKEDGSSPRTDKRPVSSNSESACLTDSLGILQSPHDINYEASYSEENTKDVSGSM